MDQEDFSSKGYKLFLSHRQAEAPLTEREQEMIKIKLSQVQCTFFILFFKKKKNELSPMTHT